MQAPKELKIEFIKRLGQIFVIGNIVVYFLLFALVYSLWYTNLLTALIKTIDGLIWVLLIEGIIFLIIGLVTKNEDYSFMITPRASPIRITKEEKNIMDLLDDPAIFNEMVRFTKRLLILAGICLIIFSSAYIILVLKIF